MQVHVREVSEDEKRLALEQVLRSAAFRRSDQLRHFLSFVVDEAIAGRGAEITECDIAVKALRRPDSYAPETDSTVRTRAHALRQKLAEYYREEAPHAEVRIEIPKGGYIPRFVRPVQPVLAEADAAGESLFHFSETTAVVADTADVRLPRWRHLCGGAGIAVVFVALLGAAAWWWDVIQLHPSVGRSAQLNDVWAPIFASTTPVRVVISSPPQLWVRDYGDDPPPVVDPVSSPPVPGELNLLSWFGENMPVSPKTKLYFHTNTAGALWGDAAGIQVATHFLTANAIANELVPEKSLKSGYVFRNDSFLAFGRSEYSPLLAAMLPSDGLDAMYLPHIRRHGIALRRNPAQGPIFLPTVGATQINYGLITVLRDTTDDGRTRQAMLFSGVISNGAQGAVEFMTTPRHLDELAARLRQSGIRSWPKALQIVVRIETNQYYPLRTDYETHLILRR